MIVDARDLRTKHIFIQWNAKFLLSKNNARLIDGSSDPIWFSILGTIASHRRA